MGVTGIVNFAGNTDYAIIRNFYRDAFHADSKTITNNGAISAGTNGQVAYELICLDGTDTQLRDIQTQSNGKTLGGNYALENDVTITLSPWLPIGTNGAAFTGNFTGIDLSDTSNFAITTVTITSGDARDYQGLFGEANGSTVDSINVTSAINLTGASDYTGGVFGNLVGGWAHNINSTVATLDANLRTGGFAGQANAATITYSTSSGFSTASSHYHGGIVGITSNSAIIKNCSSTADIATTGGDSGGIVGALYGASSLIDSFATGTISSSWEAGGLIGSGFDATVTRCYATGNATSTAIGNAGGLVAYSRGTETYKDCYATGNATATADNAGGFIGRVASTTNVGFDNCYATGNASSVNNAGGFIGETTNTGTATFTDCHATGTATITTQYAGGFMGRGSSAINNFTRCFAIGDVNNTGLDSQGGFVGEIDGATSFDMNSCWASGKVLGNGYIGGLIGDSQSGTVLTVNDSYYAGQGTAADITSEFNACGGIIGNQTTAADTFNRCYSNGTMSAVSTAGGIVGSGQGTYNKCFSNMSIAATGSSLGGFIGYAGAGLIINDSYATGNVADSAGTGNIGAFGGYGNGAHQFNRCYSTGVASGVGGGGDNIGGIIAKNLAGGVYTDCYSSGTTAVGIGSNEGVILVANMDNAGSFTNFDSITPVWVIDEDVHYPYLYDTQYKLEVDDTTARFAHSGRMEPLVTGYNWTNGGNHAQILPITHTAIIAYIPTAGTESMAYFPDMTTLSNNTTTTLAMPSTANTVNISHYTGVTTTSTAKVAQAVGDMVEIGIRFSHTDMKDLIMDSGYELTTSANSSVLVNGLVDSSVGGDDLTFSGGTGNITFNYYGSINAGIGDVTIESTAIILGTSKVTAANLNLHQVASAALSVDGAAGYNLTAAELEGHTLTGSLTIGQSTNPEAFTLGKHLYYANETHDLIINGTTMALGAFHIDNTGNNITLNGTGAVTGSGDISGGITNFTGLSINLSGALTAITASLTTTAGALVLTNAANNIAALGATAITGGDFDLVTIVNLTLAGAINVGAANDITIKSPSITFTAGSMNADTVHLMQADNAAFSLDGIQSYNINYADIDAYITANTFNLGNLASPGIFHLTHPANARDIEFLSTGFTNVNIYANGVYDNCALARHNSANVINNVGDILLSPCRDLQFIPTSIIEKLPQKETIEITSIVVKSLPQSIPAVAVNVVEKAIIKIDNARIEVKNLKTYSQVIQDYNPFFGHEAKSLVTYYMTQKFKSEFIEHKQLIVSTYIDQDDTIKRLLKGNKQKARAKANIKTPAINLSVIQEEDVDEEEE